MNISVPDKLYERYKRNEERLNASRVCAEALARELDVLEGVEGVGEQDEAAVMQMVERLMDAKEHSYGWGYGDGRAWGLAHATRARGNDEIATTVLKRGNQRGNRGGIVGAVAIHEDDDIGVGCGLCAGQTG